MGKAPAFQFYPGDWRRDTQVQMASMETRGVWIEMLCCMWDAPTRGVLEGDVESLSRLLGCEREVLQRAIFELKRLQIADVTICNSDVTVCNRRMKREEKDRKDARLRVQRHRVKRVCNADVTPPSSTSSSTSKNKNTTYVELGCVFCVWQTYLSQMDRNPQKYKFTPKRKNKIKSRLKDSTQEEIYNAIVACANSPHHQGKNEQGTRYQDICDHVLKSREKVEWWNDRPKQEQSKYF